MFNVRPYEYGDLHYLNDVCLKGVGEPFPVEFWNTVAEEGGDVLIATHFNEPVGFLVWVPERQARRLIRICLKPPVEGYGVDALLIRAFKYMSLRDGVRVV